MMKISWLKKIIRKGDTGMTNGKITVLPTAKEALEGTKAPQLRNCIDEINSAVKRGRSHVYVGDGEKLHKETIEFLTKRGYDIWVTCFKEKDSSFKERDEYFNEVYWGENATGQYSYNEK